MAVKRGSSWQGIVHDPRLPGGRARRSFDTKEEAETWELETKLNVRGGALVERSASANRKRGLPHTLKELLDYTVEHHWSTTRGKAKSEINARQVIAILGPNLPIGSVDMMALDKVRTALRKTGNALATINRKMSALGMMLTKAKDLGVIQAAPRVKRYKEAENRVRRFTPEEEAAAEAFFHRIGHEEMRDFVLFSLDTGLRQSEALGLTSANFVNGKVQVWGHLLQITEVPHGTAHRESTGDRREALRWTEGVPMERPHGVGHPALLGQAGGRHRCRGR